MAVRPQMFADAIAEVLRHVNDDDVVVLADECPEAGDWAFDAAIVTAVPPALRADVVIELPSEGHVDTEATVRRNGSSSVVTVSTPLQLVTLLDEYCPTIDGDTR